MSSALHEGIAVGESVRIRLGVCIDWGVRVGDEVDVNESIGVCVGLRLGGGNAVGVSFKKS